jgi:pimeloyl-ACP methyl ester carboxylesterase
LNLDFLERAPGRRLACRRRAGRGPTLVFLPGYASDMEGGKASALDAWAEAEGRAMLRFDYAGCGASPGVFEDQDLEAWRDDALAMIDSVEGPVLLVGSSMGGWIMLLAALARPEKVAGLVGIAAAPDFTRWGFSDVQKETIRVAGRLEEPSPYGDAPTITTHAFWESGERQILLDRPIPIACPVRLLHGTADADVPWRISLELMERLESPNVEVVLVKDGDHRLSRPPDIGLLIRSVGAALEQV